MPQRILSPLHLRDRLFLQLLPRVSFALAVLALAVVLLLPRERSFVVEALTEHVELRDFIADSGEGWRIDGFTLCVRSADDLFDDGADAPAQCAEQPQPVEPFLRVEPGGRVLVQRLGESDLTVEVAPVGEGADEIAHLASFSGAEPERPLFGTLHLTRDRQLDWPLGFRAVAVLGQIPDPGVAGILLSGRAASNIEGRLGAGHYEVGHIDLVAGDVVSMGCGDWRGWLQARWWGRQLYRVVSRDALLGSCNTGVHGFLRLAPPDNEGLVVVMTGKGDHLRIDRLGAKFPLEPTWAARLTRDPLALALAAICTLLGAVLALLPARRQTKGGK